MACRLPDQGTVTHATGCGVFVDIGAADGLVHRSEITWDKAVDPTTFHAVGDAVRVVVSSIDQDHGRISLITRLVPFGAFARIRAVASGQRGG